MADNTQKDTASKWWGVAKDVAYELRPFSLPTLQGVKNAAEATKTNAGQLWATFKELVPALATAVKGLNPLMVLMVFAWLCGWAGFIWLEFGAVYFIVSAMVMIFTNLGERDESEWSAYSVFNAGCRALLGTMNAEQFEREIMRQNVAAPDDHHDREDDAIGAQQEDEFVWVEPAPGAAGAAGAANSDDEMDSDDEDGSDDGDDGGGGAGPGGRAGGRRVSGKRARRGFEERRERREERRLAMLAMGPDAWD